MKTAPYLRKILRLAIVVGAFWTTTLMAVEKLDQVEQDGSQGEEKKLPLTIVESDFLEMKSMPEKNFFYFEKNVRVVGNNLTVTCNHLEIITNRKDKNLNATIGQLGAFEVIVATGNVAIRQAGRQALAGRAELRPGEGKVVLTESPRIIDEQAVVTGWRITLLKGEHKAMVESNPSNGQERPTVTLDALPDLGYKEDKNQEPTP